MFDGHLHSKYSDGSLSLPELVAALVSRSVTGFALTDHNGLWGLEEGAEEAAKANLLFVEGIEISALEGPTAIHVLGYSRKFDRTTLSAGLEPIRIGYEGRIRDMVNKCQEAGYPLVSFENILQKRNEAQEKPVLISTDVARELRTLYHLGVEQARALTTFGGSCYIPYGSWAPSISEIIELVHSSQGIACIAHPGLIAHDESEERMWEILEQAKKAGLDGVEVYHPSHSYGLVEALEMFCQKNHLIVSGGSDWHGPIQGWNTLGRSGLSEAQGKILIDALA